MNKKTIGSLFQAINKGEQVTLLLKEGEIVQGIAILIDDPTRIKVSTSEGAIWIPLQEINRVSRLIKFPSVQ